MGFSVMQKQFFAAMKEGHRWNIKTGATRSGKTYMACAFGMEACKQRYKTK